MPYPQLHDDGHAATLDLHGASVDEAVAMTQRLVRLAAARGRSRLTLVHGTSTSEARYRNRTIKHALYELLESGRLQPFVTSTWRGDGQLILGLDVTQTPDPTPIRLPDLSP